MTELDSPNIILFLVDQLRRDTLGCYGNSICKTPNLDRLAREGVQFEQAYTCSPVCSPSRVSLLTGLYPHNHGVMMNTHIAPAWSRGLSPKIPTFSRILKDRGYNLEYVGKWHVHEDLKPQIFGFDRYIVPNAIYKTRSKDAIYIKFPRRRQIVASTLSVPKEQSHPWRYTEQGIQFLKERAAEEHPFFLRIDTPAPHFPNNVPEPFASLYEPSDIPPWKNYEESFAGKPTSHLRKHQEWHLQDKNWDWWSRVLAKYFGQVTLLDTCIGNLIQAVRDAGIENNTVIIFSTDHGDSIGSHKHFEKGGTMYDEVLRIPLLIKNPYSPALKVQNFVRLLDLMPTILELGRAELPHNLDGMSLLPFLEGKKPQKWPDSVYSQHHGEVWGYQSQRMVRTKEWKYVYNAHDIDELYNLRNDPYELENIMTNETYQNVLEEMKARMIGWNDATKDMFQWPWVRWNFPKPVKPLDVSKEKLPFTYL